MKKIEKVWLLIDNRKNKPCYADEKGTERYKLGFAAVLFKKPNLKKWNLGAWRGYKTVVPATISYEIPNE